MRSMFGSIACLLVMLVIGCSTVSPDECWPNTSGGFGGGGTIPIGAGVGATTSGDFISPPPNGPLDYGGPPNSNPCMGSQIRYFKSSDFPFATTIADDGTKTPGGWQVTDTTLIFIYDDVVSCRLGIGMPLRTQLMGAISASKAARLCAGVANDVAGPMWPTDLPPGIFCSKFKDKFFQEFKEQYPGVGIRPESP
jgi:hypothetical protein